MILDGNTGVRSGPFTMLVRRFGKAGAFPSLHVQFLNTHIPDSLGWGAAYFHVRGSHLGSVIEPVAADDPAPKVPVAYAHVFRGNRLNGGTDIQIAGAIEGVIVENNTIRNGERGIFVNSGRDCDPPAALPMPRAVLLRNNVTENVTTPLAGDRLTKPSP